MEVRYKPRFKQALLFTPKHIQESVFDIILKLEASETLENAGADHKRMEGQKKGDNYYRIRVGQYRMGIEYIKPDVMLITILSRGDIYKSFPAK